ncbi:glycosyltransferase family 4 protein [Spirillospora sp. NPDC048911]|uniref:glycosyltransferase family 4 protein n=1 Tax=Spirillospora sp. NPDC048911 TaxID=3364527 RepID=UPI0037140E19
MRITYAVLHAYGMGGTIRTVVNQANAMAAAGHDVRLASVVRRRTEPQFAIDPRVRLVDVVDQREASRNARAPRAREGRLWRRTCEAADTEAEPGVEVPAGEAAKEVFTRAVERAFAAFLRDLDDDVVVTTRPGLNLLAAWHAPERLVRVAQDHMHLGRYKPEVRAAIVESYPRLDAVVSLTSRDRAEYDEALAGRVRTERIPNPLHSLDVPRTGHSSRVVAAAGRLTAQKGFDLLIPAFAQVAARHPDWRLHIYGAGKAEKRLRKLVHRHHLYNHVLLMGSTSQLDTELAKASIYTLSSRFEGFPMILLEALNCGLPVASFDCPTGPREVIVDGVNGLLVPPEDGPGLAAAICRLIEDEPLRRRLGAAARETAAEYGPEAMRGRWETLLADLLQRKSSLGQAMVL